MAQISDDLLSHPCNQYLLVDREQTFLDSLQILEKEGGNLSWFLIVDLGEGHYLGAPIEYLRQRTKGGSRDILNTPLKEVSPPLVPVPTIEQHENLDVAVSEASRCAAQLVIVTLLGVVVGIISLESLSDSSSLPPAPLSSEHHKNQKIEAVADSFEDDTNTRQAHTTKQGSQGKKRPAKISTDVLTKLFQRVKKNPLVSITGFLIITLIPTIWLFANEILPALTAEPPTMTGEWNIAVAGFTSIGEEPIRKDAATLIGEVFYNRLDAELTDLRDEIDIIIQVWGPEETGAIKGVSPEERSAAAENLAKKINADLIIYGSVEKTGNAFYLNPEFYIAIENFYEAEEMVGQHALGEGISVAGGNGQLPSQIELNRELSLRSQVLALITRGLGLFFIHAYDDAYQLFAESNRDDYWPTNKGREVAYLFQGNAASKAFMLDEAEGAYLRSLDIEPEYARAYAGLGSVYYLQSLEGISSDNFFPNMEALNDALESYNKALTVEIQPPSADISTKVAFGTGQIYLTQWFTEMDTLPQAITQFESVIEQYNNSENSRIRELAAESHARLGLIARELGKVDDAIAQFSTSIEISTLPSRRGLYWATLADLYTERGDTNNAHAANKNSIDEYTAALSLTIQEEIQASYWAAIATRHERIGEIAAAVNALERAINLLPVESEERVNFEGRLNALR